MDELYPGADRRRETQSQLLALAVENAANRQDAELLIDVAIRDELTDKYISLSDEAKTTGDPNDGLRGLLALYSEEPTALATRVLADWKADQTDQPNRS